MKYSIIFTTVIAFAVSSQVVSAGEITDPYTTGDTLTATTLDNIKAAVNDNDGNVSTNSFNIGINTTNIANTVSTVSSLKSQISDLSGEVNTLSDQVSVLSDVIHLIGCNAMTRSATFDYTSNSGIYTIGTGKLQFDTKWSTANSTSIHLYNDPANILTVAVVPTTETMIINEVADAASYDGSVRSRTPVEGQLAVIKNIYENYAVLKIVSIQAISYGDPVNELDINYCILPFGQTDFRN